MLLYLALLTDISDSEKLALMYEKHKNKMYFTAYSVLNDRFLAEDAVHEAFIAVARNLSRLNIADSPETAAYLCRAAKTRALNILARRRETVQELENEDITFEESGFDEVCEKSEVSRIAECINRLPDIYRTVIVLRYLDGEKPRDISKSLALNTETVKKRLLRGKEMLKNMLTEDKR